MSFEAKHKIIIDLLSSWIAQLKGRNKHYYYDMNISAQTFICKLLNMVYGYSLRDLDNRERSQGIDLGDTENKIAYSVTSRLDGRKIAKDLAMCKLKKLDQKYSNGILFFLLSIEIPKGLKNGKKYQDIGVPVRISCIVELIDDIKLLFVKDTGRFNEIVNFIREEIPIESLGDQLPKHLTNVVKVAALKVVGRDKIIQDIHEVLLLNPGCLLVSAYGGIGKSTVLQEYVRQYEQEYDHIVFIEVATDFDNIGSSEVDLLDPVFKAFLFEKNLISNLKIDIPEKTTLRDGFEKIINRLANVKGKNNLLILDNVSSAIAKIRENFPPSNKWKVLAASREKVTNWKELKLKVLDPSDAFDLFEFHYQLKIENKQIVKKILETIQYHTYAIELFAISAREHAWTLDILYKKIKKIHEGFNDTIEFEAGRKAKSGTIIQHIINVFLLDEITTINAGLVKKNLIDVKEVLTVFSVLPSIPIKLEELYHWLKIKTNDRHNFQVVIERLYKLGWLRKHRLINSLSYQCHSIVQFAVLSQIRPTSKNCKDLIKSFIKLTDVKIEKGDHGVYKKRFIIYADNLINTLYPASEQFIKEDKYLANLLDNMGWIYLDLDNPVKSLDYRQKDIKIKKAVLNPLHAHFAHSYNNLGLTYRRFGEYDKSLECYFKAESIHLKRKDSLSLHLSTTYVNIAYVHLQKGDFECALKYCVLCHKIRIRIFNKDDPHMGQSYNNAAQVYRQMGKYRESIRCNIKSLRVREKVLDPLHPNLAVTYNNIGMLYYDIQEYALASDFMQKALFIRREVLKGSHSDTKQSVKNMNKIKEALNNKTA